MQKQFTPLLWTVEWSKHNNFSLVYGGQTHGTHLCISPFSCKLLTSTFFFFFLNTLSTYTHFLITPSFPTPIPRAHLAVVCFVSLSSCSPHCCCPKFKAPFPYPGCTRRHCVFRLIFPNLDAAFEKLQVRRGRTEASFTHFSIILPLGWPFGVHLLSSSQREHREAMEVQTAAPYFQIWDPLPIPVTTETSIPWSWLDAVTKRDRKLILEVYCRKTINCRVPVLLTYKMQAHRSDW